MIGGNTRGHGRLQAFGALVRQLTGVTSWTAGIADHHPVHRSRVLEKGSRAADAPGVLIHVEQQHQAATEAARRVARSRAAT
jgi:hypothetical protein